MIICPVCDAEIDVEQDDLDEGITITCDECGADLRVVTLEPLEVAPLDDEEEEDDAADLDEDEEEEEEEEDWK